MLLKRELETGYPSQSWSRDWWTGGDFFMQTR